MLKRMLRKMISNKTRILSGGDEFESILLLLSMAIFYIRRKCSNFACV